MTGGGNESETDEHKLCGVADFAQFLEGKLLSSLLQLAVRLSLTA